MFIWWLGEALEAWEGTVLDLDSAAPRKGSFSAHTPHRQHTERRVIQPLPGGQPASLQGKRPLSHKAAGDRWAGEMSSLLPSAFPAGLGAGHLPSQCLLRGRWQLGDPKSP